MSTTISAAAAPANRQDVDVVLQRRISLPQSGKDVIVIQLNRPERLNCFNTTLCYRLAQVVRDVVEHQLEMTTSTQQSSGDQDDSSNVCAVILTSSGTSFCAGADLTDPPNPLEQSMDLPECLERNPAYQISRIPVPVIGALQGYCITGGMELALSCDILVGDTTVVFRDTHVKFGLAPCWGLSQRLTHRIGPGRAKLLSWTAQPIRAEQAYEWGLLDDLVTVVNAKTKRKDAEMEQQNTSDVSAVLRRAMEIADTIGQNQGQMVQRYKRAMKVCDNDFITALTRERALGLAHYLQVYGGGSADNNGGSNSPTFATAKDYITNRSTRNTASKL